MSHDLDTPEGRLAAIEALGPEAYNAAMQAHQQKNTVETVNGHALRYVQTERFGRLVMVGSTGKAFTTLDAAREFAKGAK